MKAIRVRNLTKDYKIYSRRGQKAKELLSLNRRDYHETKRALYDITFDVEAGECLGIIGNNGSGKSTLLKILARTSYPTVGEIELEGLVSYILDPSTGFNPDFSGRQNVFTKCALLGLTYDETEDLFPVILEFSGLGDRIDHPIRTYSTGMVVRLGFSVAIHVPFDILLVDEVLSVGDYLFQRKCINAIRAFKEQGKTILVSSHSLADASNFCDRLILLNDGAIGMIGETGGVVQAYIEDCEKRYSRIETADVEDPIYDEALTCCVERLGVVTILEVSFFDADGRQTNEFPSGSGVTMRVRFMAHDPITEPCIRVQFLRNDGLLITGSNTYRHDLKVGTVHGHYEALCHFPNMNLLEGDYYANVGVWPDEYQSFVAKTPYDIHEYNHIITMRSARIDGGGLARVPCSWSVNKLEDL
jgi:ABC-type polysaccharide/polyol phosphate transport system ATPase subunit